MKRIHKSFIQKLKFWLPIKAFWASQSLHRALGCNAEDGYITIRNYPPDIVEHYGAVGGDTRTQTIWRLHTLVWAARCAAKLPGAFVECGVHEGFSSRVILSALPEARQHKWFLMDTWSGFDPRFPGAFASPDYRDNFDEVQRSFSKHPNVSLVRGTIPDTLSRVDVRVAFLHIDMNCTTPELLAFEWFWPRLLPGAVVIWDDAGQPGFEEQGEIVKGLAEKYGFGLLWLITGQVIAIVPPRTPDLNAINERD